VSHSANRTLIHARIFGYQTLSQDWTFETFLEHVLPEDRPEVERRIHDATVSQSNWTLECRIRRADGVVRWIFVAGGGERRSDGTLARVSSIVQDITERKSAEVEVRRLHDNLEARVRERTAQLQAANRELDAFSYSASHDLRAPLQTIDGFSRALLEDYGAKVDAEARDYLERIRAASQRMAQLVDDLLRLSRITRADMAREPVDLSALARSVAEELIAREPARDVAVDIAAGEIVQGDRRLLRVLLENLFANAWKFTSKLPRARIELSAADSNGERVYCVRDDGAGFDMAYAARLFTPFQRLHSAAEFPGNGVGLATVQRIVQRHGGRAWAEGAPGKGAAFYFTITGAPAGAQAPT
jgi:PAS domain S-box-containing protein